MHYLTSLTQLCQQTQQTMHYLTSTHTCPICVLCPQQTVHYLTSLTQLCHINTDLAHTTWLDLFPRIWKILSEKNQQALGQNLTPFFCSGSHTVQKDCQPSAIHTFLEGASQCVPPIPIGHAVLKVGQPLCV